MISQELFDRILEQYALPSDGIHGIDHWARVLANGRRLSQSTGASVAIVELFSVFHDACRLNEGVDDGHGMRGAELARSFRGGLLELQDGDFDLLYTACAHHTEGWVEGDITLQTCWDADRLDLGRVGIQPSLIKLCTEAAISEDMLSWANQRAIDRVQVSSILSEWGVA